MFYVLDSTLLDDLYSDNTPSKLLSIKCDQAPQGLMPELYFDVLQLALERNQTVKGINVIAASDLAAMGLAAILTGMLIKKGSQLSLLGFTNLDKSVLPTFKCVLTNPFFAPHGLLFSRLSYEALEEVISDLTSMRNTDDLNTIVLNNLNKKAIAVLEPLICAEHVRILEISELDGNAMVQLATLLENSSIQEIKISKLQDAVIEKLYQSTLAAKLKVNCYPDIAPEWQQKFFNLNPEIYTSLSEEAEITSPAAFEMRSPSETQVKSPPEQEVKSPLSSDNKSPSENPRKRTLRSYSGSEKEETPKYKRYASEPLSPATPMASTFKFRFNDKDKSCKQDKNEKPQHKDDHDDDTSYLSLIMQRKRST